VTGGLPDPAPTSVLRLELRGCALVATIDDPDTRNAMSDALLSDFEWLLSHYGDDPNIRALVLRGNERIFCAGADLGGKTLVESAVDQRAATVNLSLRGARIYSGLNTFPKPVIAVVEGAAMGGGMGLAACADIVLAGPAAVFALSEVRLGLVAAQIAPFVVARLGPAATRRLALTGSKFNAAQAVSLGFVDEMLANRTELDQRLDEILSEIQVCAPSALAATKALLNGLLEFDTTAFSHAAAEIFAEAVLGEGAEGIAAFREKRAPAWAKK
jgi:isohexenylglutaconyl-CoA hydratase